ncbi:DUF1566 domain-containing protein [Burkholderia contaminans]|uniref:DUF1566 domain-containing protein n=1 Tax=Burkholderia contaminans TaxID=488447 RepID=UPI0014540978|nr:DUF1566 domain-containing protein [Burkholderia contaminans]VWD20339.1 hypothetical protein BCO18442_03869 [Burkholderia contaminans]
MTITLEALKAEHTKFGEMIAAFEKQAAIEYRVAGVTITLAPGERYAGLMLGENGDADYHLILLPGEAEEIEWADAGEWAEEQGGTLPTRREQSLLFANLKGEFEPSWYWSSERHESTSGWAWCQGFGNGTQGYHRQGSKFRARAVRRFIPSVF